MRQNACKYFRRKAKSTAVQPLRIKATHEHRQSLRPTPHAWRAPGPFGAGAGHAARVAGPAIGLIVVGALNILGSLYFAAQGVMVMVMPADQFQAEMQKQNPNLQGQEMPFDPLAIMQGLGAGYLVIAVLALILSVVTILGGLKMKNLQSRGMAFVAAVVAMIPCLSPCCLVGLPIGIWALVVLNDPQVKASFK